MYCKMLLFWEQQCIDLVERIGQEVDKLEEFLDPETLCKKLRLCEESAERNFDVCQVCEKSMEKLKAWLESGTLLNFIDEHITPLCDKLGQFTSKCKLVIDKLKETISKEAEKFEPKRTCELIKLC
ncbi:hypothetical protein P879_11592 [Paragonimus westermani]|uniref:Saposin B-type domain-containing protein n=1 Tax=Paragonimus westermani TaxID=34504 RepID=A0A8T0D7Z5_9TREM|nr:hypothetical protein P879_11592 [Paragonimus westermani]